MRASPAHRWSLLAAALWACSSVGHAEHYTVPLFVTSTSADAATGVVRILNNTDESGSVEIHAVDDAGMRFGTATFTLGARAAVEFDAADLASGNAAKGLSGSLGSSTAHRRLEIDTELQIEPLAFVRAPDGTLAVMHDTVRGTAGDDQSTYEVPIFNPASNFVQASRLRLINLNDEAVAVTVGARDDTGAVATGGEVELMLPAGGARTLTAQQLEAGDTSITGRLGAGVGRWRLYVSADQPIRVVSVTVSTSGHWNNLSTTAVQGPSPSGQRAFNERFEGLNVVYEMDRGRIALTPQADERFTETAESDGVTTTHTGGYGYEAVGPDAGRWTLTYDDGDMCVANLYYSTHTSGWFASYCTGADYPADGAWLGGNWSTGDPDDTSPDADDTGEPDEPAQTGDSCFAGQVLRPGESCTYPGTDENFTVNERGRGRFLAYLLGIRINVSNETVDGRVYDFRATHLGDGVWRIDRIEGRTDTSPSFGTGSAPGNQSYTFGTAIEALTLPTASGGNGTLTYALSPEVPGLSFDGATRRLTGTPSTRGSYAMIYTVTDANGDADTLAFTITVSVRDVGITSYAGGAVIADLPAGDWVPDVTSNAVVVPGGNQGRIDIFGGGYFEEGGYRYTCRNRDECTIAIGSRTVLSGPVEQTAAPLAELPSEGSPEDDRAALEALFHDMDGAYWRNSRYWLSDRPLDQWYGVETDSNGRVTGLHLGGNHMRGSISPELGRLTELRSLELAENELTGSIPPELGRLSKLEALFLVGNPLTGRIPPELGELSRLRVLWLQQTQVTGTIPWVLWERLPRGERWLPFGDGKLLGTNIYGRGPPPQRDVRRVFPADPAANGNASHHSVSYYQGPLVWRWNWRDAPEELQEPVLGRWAALAVRIDHELPEPPLVITRVLDAEGAVLTERLPEAIPARTWSLASARWRTEYVFDLPGTLYQAGHQLVHVIDPNGELPETNEGDNVGEPVRLYGVKLPPFRITFIPLHYPGHEAPNMVPSDLMARSRAFWPIADDYEATVTDPVEASFRNIFDLKEYITSMWNTVGDPYEFYHGVFLGFWPPEGSIGRTGLSSRFTRTAVSSVDRPIVIPHELGHNLDLGHPPGCNAGGVDDDYPYPNGGLGPHEGWDVNWRRYVSEADGATDIMSYCGPNGLVSDFNYRKAVRFLRVAGGPVVADGGLALSGGIDGSGVWSLGHAQNTEEGPRPPSPDGEYTLVLLGADGFELYREPLSKITYSEGDEAGWAARVPTPPQPARQVAILDAEGVEVLREALSALE